MSVSILLVRALVDAVDRAGVELRSRVAFDWQLLERPEARIDFEQFSLIASAAVEATGDAALGLHISEQMPEGAGDVLAHMAAHAPTMREAVQTISRYTQLAMDGLELAGVDEADAFVIHCTIPHSVTEVTARLLAELILGGQVRLARVLTGPSSMPRYVCFEHAQPPHCAEYTRLFESELHFGARRTAIAFERSIVDRPQLHQHPELLELLRAEAQRRLDRIALSAPISTRLHQYLVAMPVSDIPGAATAARALGMSERSLRRHLAAAGTSYRDVVRAALESSAGRMLRDRNRTIKETSAALGFADPAAFHRAFKRWTGRTPGEYRRAHTGD